MAQNIFLKSCQSPYGGVRGAQGKLSEKLTYVPWNLGDLETNDSQLQKFKNYQQAGIVSYCTVRREKL